MTVPIVTTQCPNCNTFVAGNVFDGTARIRCPRLDCEELLEIQDPPQQNSGEERYVLR